jgi:hypothetical protein
MSNSIWTAFVSLKDNVLDRSTFTKAVTVLPVGSPILYNMVIPEQASSSAFLQEFIRILRANWKSQDTPLIAYSASATVSDALYVKTYYNVKKCTRFSTFVEREVDHIGANTTNVDPSKLTTVFLSALYNSLFDASGNVPTEAGLQFWGQFASSNTSDKVNLVIDGIYVDVAHMMKPKCAADADNADASTDYTGYFGIEVIRGANIVAVV